MEPLAIAVRGAGEWVITHQCTGCGALVGNRTAGDDNPSLLVQVAARPLVNPSFPLERLAPFRAGGSSFDGGFVCVRPQTKPSTRMGNESGACPSELGSVTGSTCAGGGRAGAGHRVPLIATCSRLGDQRR